MISHVRSALCAFIMKAAETKSNRASWPMKQQHTVEPRKQRAAAMVAKDAMILMSNNAVVKDIIKSPSSTKRDHPAIRPQKRTSNASASSPSSAKHGKNSADSSLSSFTLQASSSKSVPEIANDQSNGNFTNEHSSETSDVNAPHVPSDLSKDLSINSYPRELTVKEGSKKEYLNMRIMPRMQTIVCMFLQSESKLMPWKHVLAKSMRASRVGMRNLSRDIVDIINNMQTEESSPVTPAVTSQVDNEPSTDQQSSQQKPNQEPQSTVRKVENVDTKKKNSQKSKVPISVSLEDVISSVILDAKNASMNIQHQINDSRRQDRMTVQEVIAEPLPSPSITKTSTPKANKASKDVDFRDLSPGKAEQTKKAAETKSILICDEEMLGEDDVRDDAKNRLGGKVRRELSNSEKLLIIADFDAGMVPHELQQKFKASKIQIAEVLSNRVPIIRQQTASSSDGVALKRRRTNFVGLNIMMWRFFCDCRDQGIFLNGRQLKEHALTIARQLGLHNFKGSEGWLDSFKRRHNIDLKTMTGHPVIYETDNDGNVFCPGENMNDSYCEYSDYHYFICIFTALLFASGIFASVSCIREFSAPRSESPRLEEHVLNNSSSSMIVDANQFLIDAADAAARAVTSSKNANISTAYRFSPSNNLNTLAIAACNTGDMGPCKATAAVHTTQPLDLAMLPATSSGISTNSGANKTTPSANLARGSSLLTPLSDLSGTSNATLQALVDSCCYRVDEPEITHAMETIRSYITLNDMSLLPTLVTLQKGLAAIAYSKRSKQSTSNQHSNTVPTPVTVTVPSVFLPESTEPKTSSVSCSPVTSSSATVVHGIRVKPLNDFKDKLSNTIN
ncbi:unnamed protein product [Anisakis simplex]|uniref:HTH CENPB-type domain-containing protein n=1 Tax=Anisakis simplex TaxID=6269 RepID=A0A0M3K3I1_ANISI|nr:unnamed protein product [Anisakis simplex]